MLELNLDLKKCVGNSTDGAANMQGRYNGFSSLLAKEALVTSAILFSLLNDIAIFFRDSYQRMNIWSQYSTTTKRLGTIGETRWWSKDSALRKAFGSYNNPSGHHQQSHGNTIF